MRAVVSSSWCGRRTAGGGLVLLQCLAGSSAVRAQDDGARLSMMVSNHTTNASLRLHMLHSNLAPDDATPS